MYPPPLSHIPCPSLPTGPCAPAAHLRAPRVLALSFLSSIVVRLRIINSPPAQNEFLFYTPFNVKRMKDVSDYIMRNKIVFRGCFVVLLLLQLFRNMTQNNFTVVKLC